MTQPLVNALDEALVEVRDEMASSRWLAEKIGRRRCDTKRTKKRKREGETGRKARLALILESMTRYP